MDLKIEELTVKQVREIAAAAGCCAPKADAKVPLPFGVGDKILIRTVTMIDVGRVRAIGRDFIVLEDGGWVADTGRFSEMLATGKLNEFERAPSWFLVGRGSICDLYPWDHPLPSTTK
jgi:hypothetical protein